MTDHINRRNEILDAAENRYFVTGYKKTTLAEIAGDIGLVKSAIYKHFKNKEELFEATLNRIVDKIMLQAENAVKKQQHASDKLLVILLSVYDGVLKVNSNFRSSPEVWHELRPHVLRVDRQYYTRFVNKVARIIAEGIEKGEFNCSNPQMVGFMMHMLFSSLHELVFLGGIEAEQGYEYIRFSINTILNGILVKGSK